VKKFVFRLQRVLKLREAHEKQRLGEFGREQQRLMEEENKLKLFRTEREMQINEARAERTEPFSAWSQGVSHRYLLRIGNVVDFQQTRVQNQEQSVTRARLRYMDARRDTRILEILREKKTDEWRAESLSEEAKVLDEVGSRKAGGEETC
jgi:flagellar protein FliJ